MESQKNKNNNKNNNNNKWQHSNLDEKDPEESGFHRYAPMAGAVALVLVLGGAGAALISKMAGKGEPSKPFVQQISIVMPPPPPPPPPKLEEPEPEEQLELETPELEPVVDDSSDAPPGEDLGLDADGVAGSDAFGLKAKKGGRGLLGSGDAFAWYAGILQRDLQKLLSNDDAIRGLGEYTVVVSVSLTPDGYVQESQLLSGSNNPKLDDALRRALSSGVRLSREPPEDLPQPIRLRISSRS
jgi:periplasmic protein TonB